MMDDVPSPQAGHINQHFVIYSGYNVFLLSIVRSLRKFVHLITHRIKLSLSVFHINLEMSNNSFGTSRAGFLMRYIMQPHCSTSNRFMPLNCLPQPLRIEPALPFLFDIFRVAKNIFLCISFEIV